MGPTPHPHNQVRSLLIVLLDKIEYAANLIIVIECTAYSQDRGQEVWRVLHREEERRSSLLLVLSLAMEYTSYSLSLISRVGCLLHCEDEEYSVYSITRRRGRVHHLLLPSSLQLSMQPTPHPPVYDGGWGVCRLLHHKEGVGLLSSLWWSTQRTPPQPLSHE